MNANHTSLMDAASVIRPVKTALQAFQRALLLGLWLAGSLLTAPAGVAKEVTSPGVGVGFTWSTSWVDVSGDGRTDYCYLYGTDGDHIGCHFAQPDGSYPATPSLQQFIERTSNGLMWWADVDGDGRPDLCRADAATRQFTSAYAGTKTGHVVWCRTAASSFTQGPTSTYAIHENNPYAPWSRLMFADVNGDRITDLCQVTITVADQYGQVRCRLGSSTGFGDYSAKWTSMSIRLGNPARPSTLVDVNGDGFPDFCRVPDDSTLKCLLGSEDGFTTTDITSAVLDAGYVQGAEFVDGNADGMTDYCRITGPAGRYQLRCTLSNGVGWDSSGDRVSPVIPDAAIGHAAARWWIDINADGLPDYCRATGAALDTSGANDGTSTLLCRLNKGDDSAADPGGGFYYSDIELPQVRFGRGDMPRQWCDPTGSGFPTLCRNTHQVVTATGSACDESGCPVLSESFGLITGFGADNTAQALHPLLTAYTDGLGAETRIGYLPLTSPEVYTRSGITNTERRFVGPPPTSPVVYETRAWMVGSSGAGSDLTGNARYFYRDLTTDPWAGTSLGFSERWMFSEGTNTIDHTQFFQGLGDGNGSVANDPREVGMVRRQVRYAVNSGVVPTPANNGSEQSQRKQNEAAILSKVVDVLGGTGGVASKATIESKTSASASPFILLQSTDNTLKDTEPPNPRYRYIGESSVQSFDYNGSARVALPATRTTTTQDNFGNVTRIEQTKTQSAASGTLTWSSVTENTYDGDPKWRRLGRLKKSTVSSSAPSLDAQIAANTRSAGTSANAAAVSSSLPAVGQEAPKPLPLPPQLLMPILQLLLED